MQRHPERPSLFRSLTALALLRAGANLTIEDREQRCRWIALVQEAAGEGIELAVTAKGNTLLLAGPEDVAIRWELDRVAAPDVVLGFDYLRLATGRHDLRVFCRPADPGVRARLGGVAEAIVYASRGTWRGQVASAALGLRVAVREDGACSVRAVAARLSSAASGWTMRSGRAGQLQLGVWRILVAETDDEAALVAARLGPV